MTREREEEKNLVDKNVKFCGKQVNELFSILKPSDQKYNLKTTTAAAATTTTTTTTNASRSEIY
jgi:hypothetical protein